MHTQFVRDSVYNSYISFHRGLMIVFLCKFCVIFLFYRTVLSFFSFVKKKKKSSFYAVRLPLHSSEPGASLNPS